MGRILKGISEAKTTRVDMFGKQEISRFGARVWPSDGKQRNRNEKRPPFIASAQKHCAQKKIKEQRRNESR